MLAALVCLFGLAPAAFAQSTGEVTGVATDASGAVIPGAELRLKNIGTGVSVAASANDEGLYRFTNLQPGACQLNADKAGFAPTLINNIAVEVNRVTSSAITGRLTAPDGAVIAGANVRVVNVNSGVSLGGRPNEVGLYRISPLQPGAYRVEVEAQGFQRLVRAEITVQVSQVVELDDETPCQKGKCGKGK